MISSLVFVVAWVFPPGIYKRLMGESDLIFLDVEAALFYAACVAAFLLGVYLVAVYCPSGPLTDRRLEPRISPTAFILGPVLVGLLLHSIGIVSVLKKGVLLQLLLSGDRAATSSGTWAAEGTIGLSGTLLTGIIWWALWRYRQLKLSRASSLVTRLFIYLAIISVLVSFSLMQDRTGLTPVIVGTAIIVLLRKKLQSELDTRVVLTFSGVVLAISMACFVLFAELRGINEFEGIVSSVIGYTISSYNRLSALLSGRLQYPYGGRGLYLSGFLAFNNLFNSIVPVREMLRWPDFYYVWDSEFGAVWRANLDGKFIWSGTFGYIYSDLGWLSPGFMFLYGLLYGWVWRSVCGGRAFGIVLYPWCAFCILFWFGTNLLLDTPSAMLVIVALVLSGYDFMMAGEGTMVFEGTEHAAQVKCPRGARSAPLVAL
jgi:hypothetical protein